MSDERYPGDRPRGQDPDRVVESELRALAETTAAGRPTPLRTMDQIRQALRRADADLATNDSRQGRWLMRLTEQLKRRPRYAVGFVTAALAVAVLMLPISTERVVGQDVTLTIHGRELARPELRAIADQLKAATAASSVRVRMENADLTITASGRSHRAAEVTQRIEALLRTLRAQGMTAEAQVVPRREKVESRVYAAALSKIFEIRVSTSGKTDSQVEDEIRDQMTRAGVTPTSVQFQRAADGTHLNIEAAAAGREIKIVRNHNDTTETEVNVSVDDLDTVRDPGMTDAELAEKIRKQLEAKGLSATVTVSGGRIEVRAQHHKAATP